MRHDIETDYCSEGSEYPSTFILFSPDDEPRRVLLGDKYGVVNSYNGEAQGADTMKEAKKILAEMRKHDPEHKENIYIVNNFDEAPFWFSNAKLGTKWVRTDAWRGYTDFVFDKKKWKEVASGWVTSWPDDTTSYKIDAAEVYEKLMEGELVPNFPIIWCFGVTSNVFSTSSTVLIPVDRDIKELFCDEDDEDEDSDDCETRSERFVNAFN